MATYRLTAADRRALARMNAAKRNTARSSSYLAKSQTSGETAKKDPGVLTKVGHTIGDVGADIVFGAVKGIEGIVDLGAGLVGLVGGLFDDGFEDNIKSFIETDWVGKVATPVDSYFEHSYTNGSKVGEIIEGAASGIGQMLPSVAVTIATAGIGGAVGLGAQAATKLGQAAGLAALGVSAVGTGAEEAYKDGASFEQGLGYGALSGATEVATERLLPGPADAILGKTIFKKGASEVAEQGAKRTIKNVAKESINEGFEEMVSDATNPLRKTIYKGRDALTEYSDPEFYSGVLEAGATGALTSIGYSATVGNIYNKAKGLNGDIDASISSIEKLNDNKARLQERGELNDTSEAEIDAKIEQNLKQIEAVLGKSSASDRAKYIKNYELSGRFSEDGVLNAKAEDTSGLDKQYVSADTRGQEARIKAALDKEGVTAFHGELSERGSEALKEVYKAHNALNKLGFAGKHVVIVNEMTDTNAYLDGDIIAIGKDMLENGEHIKKLVHETTHFTEGSKEWVQVADFVFGKDASKVKTNLAKEISAVLNGGYGITQADVDAVVDHIKSGYETKLTAKQVELIEEVVANRMENMFGDSESIERICREKPSLAKRIWERIKALIDSLGQTSSEREEIKKLRETERLFRAALETGGQDYIIGEIEEKIHFSKKVTSSGDKFVFVEQSSIDELMRYPGDSLQAKVRNYMKNFRGTVLPLGSTDAAYMRREAEGEYTNPAKAVSDDAYNDKLRAASELENLLSCANFIRHDSDNGRHPDAVRGWNYHEIKYVVPTEDSGYHAYRGEIQIKLIARGDCFYDITKIEDITNGSAGQALIKAAGSDSTSSNTIISQNQKKSTPEVKKSKKIQHSYKGEHAEDADHGLLAQARELEADGVSSEDIRQKTGWFKSYDGKWRYEIDDSKMEFIGAEVGKETTLGKAIKHDELFKAYPQLKDVRFKLEELKNKDGQYDFTNNILTLSPSLIQNGKLIPKAKSLLIHEIQHAIQHIEGFARGGSADVYAQQMIKKKTLVLSHMSESAKRTLMRIEEDYGEESREYAKEYYNLLTNPKDTDAYWRKLSTLESYLQLFGAWDLTQRYLKQKADITDAINKISKDAWDQYQKTAGEIEAYDVGKRVDFTSDQRKNTRPDVDQDKVFFADDSHLNSVSDGDIKEPVTSINEEKMQDSEGKAENGDLFDDTIDKELLAFCKSVKNMTNKKMISKRKKRLGVISSNHAKIVNEIFKQELNKTIDVSGYELWIDGSAITHTEIRHGEQGKADSSMSDLDVARITWAANNADSGELLRKNGRLDLNYRFKNSDQSPSAKIKLRKNIGDTILYVVECVPDAVNKQLHIESAYISIKKDSNGQELNIEPQSSPQQTSKTLLDSNATTISIPDNSGIVNSSTKKSLKISHSGDRTRTTIGSAVKELIYENGQYETEAKIIAREIAKKLQGKGKANAYLDTENRSELLKRLSTALQGEQNATEWKKAAEELADYILTHSYTISAIEDIRNEDVANTLKALKTVQHSIDLSGIKAEISKHYAPKDNSAYFIWGKKESGISPSEAAKKISELGVKIEGESEADIFFEIDALYKNTIKELHVPLGESVQQEEYKQYREAIIAEIRKDLGKYSNPKYIDTITARLTEKLRVIGAVTHKAQQFKDIKLGTFNNATQYKPDLFKQSITQIANIKHSGNLSVKISRSVFFDLVKWYTKENPMLYMEGVADDSQLYNEAIAKMLQFVADGQGAYSVEQLKCISNLLDYFKHFINNYNKAYIDGKWVEIAPLAKKHVDIIKENEKIPSGIVRKLILKYRTKFDDPMALMRYLDGYQDGYCTQLYERLRRGVIDAEVWKMHIHQRIDEVIKKHKGLQKALAKKNVKYTAGKKTYDIPLNQAMYLYMTMKREDALMAHAKSGFEYKDKNGKYHRVEGCASSEAITDEEQARPLVTYARNKLYEEFNEAEREYISLIEQIFNEDCKKAKSETDLKRDGYSHVKEGYYCPISINDAAHSIDGSNMFTQLNSDLGAFSFNKQTVKGQKHELKLQPLTEVFDRHVNQVAVYSNIALTADSFSRIFNLDISGNSNKSVSVKNAIKNTWDGTEKYIRDILAGIKGKSSDAPKWLSQLRSNYAKFALGGNLKVPVTQLSSLFASINILDIGCITKGIAVTDKGDVDKYCSLAALRNYDNSAAMAQAVIDRSASVSGKIDKVGDVLMKHIGLADRFVVKWLWGSCQLQVEKNGGGKLGTEENKVEAGKLLERVLLETQQNSLLTERSAGMRGHFIYQTVTMFSADAMKVVGRVFDAFGMARFTKYRLQLAKNRSASKEEISKLEAELKKVRGMEARAVTALVSTSVMMYLIGLLFKALYNNLDDEYEEKDVVGIAQDAVSQTLGNMLGGLPIIRDIATKLMDGYDIDNYAYSAVNDLIDSFTSLYDSIADGDERNLGNRLKNISYAVGQILGIPVRNVYNTLYGLTKRVSPGSAYKWDNMLEAQSYSADLKKAIEKDDQDMISSITGLVLKENVGSVSGVTVQNEISKLSSEGYYVLPRSVGNSVTYGGEEIALSKKQQNRFKELYSAANEGAAKLVGSLLYNRADEEAKAKAIKFLYDTYYNLALQEVLDVDLESKNVLFAEAIDIEDLAIIYSIASGIESDKDRKGNVISGSRKAKIEKYVESLRMSAAEKYLVMGYLGYKCKNGADKVKAYVSRLNLTKDEKARLMQYCGYAA